jgi:hypothetical protein
MARIMKSVITVFTLIISLSYAHGSTSDALRRFYKCYSIMTQSRPAIGNEELSLISKGKLTATEGCMRIFDTAKLNEKNMIADPKGNNLGRKVLGTFQAFHDSWFTNYMPYMADDSPLNFDIIELEEPAFFVTQALLNKNLMYKSIVRGSSSWKGRRQSDKASDFLIGTSSKKKHLRKSHYRVPRGNGLEETKWTPTYLEKGQLIGFQKNLTGQEILPAHSNRIFFPEYFNEKVDIHKSLGGGFMGTNSYILFNNGRAHGVRSDGKNKMFRAYSRQLISDILCRDLPVLTPEDSVKYLNKTTDVSYGNNKSCMSCHATMDTMAGLLRNAELIINDAEYDSGSSHLKFHKATLQTNESYKLYDVMEKYYLSRPYGRFVYRDLKDNLFDEKVESFEELGAQITKTYDFYACAATRYLYYFTGVRVPMSELRASKKDKVVRFTDKISLNLQKNQDLRQMLQQIFESEWF